MNLQINKSYKMRNGKKMTVEEITGRVEGWDFRMKWEPSGSYSFICESPYDIIAEWVEPTERKEGTFHWAIEQMGKLGQGKISKVKRKGREYPFYYLHKFDDGKSVTIGICTHSGQCEYQKPICVDFEDIYATDWEVKKIVEPKKTLAENAMEIKDSRDIYQWLKKEEEIWRNHRQTSGEWRLCCDKKWVALNQEVKEALSLYYHLKQHPEVQNSPIFTGEPCCKLCNTPASKIAEEEWEKISKRTDKVSL